MKISYFCNSNELLAKKIPHISLNAFKKQFGTTLHQQI